MWLMTSSSRSGFGLLCFISFDDDNDGSRSAFKCFIASVYILFFSYFPCRNNIFISHHVPRPRVGSQIFQAWRKFMDEIETQSKQIRLNAEQLENLCSDRMSQLYQDKRKSRKQYQEEHAKIASQFAHVSHIWEHRLTLEIPRDASTSSPKHLQHSVKIPLRSSSIKKNNFEEWERKFHLFIWTWWWSTIRHPRVGRDSKWAWVKCLDDAAYLIYFFSKCTHVPSSLFEVLCRTRLWTRWTKNCYGLTGWIDVSKAVYQSTPDGVK